MQTMKAAILAKKHYKRHKRTVSVESAGAGDQ